MALTHRRAALVAAAAALLAGLPAPADAGHSYNATGLAVRGAEAYRLSIGGHLDQLGPPGTFAFGLVLYAPDPGPDDVSAIRIFEAVEFVAATNFVNADQSPDPVVVQTDYWAESTTPGVDFRLDGVRAAQTVTATGHYQDFTLHVAPSLIAI